MGEVSQFVLVFPYSLWTEPSKVVKAGIFMAELWVERPSQTSDIKIQLHCEIITVGPDPHP